VDGASVYQAVRSSPLSFLDPGGLESYIINRQLNPSSKKTLESTSQYNPLSHTFVATIRPDGRISTYSWGNGYDAAGNGLWYENAPEDVSAVIHARLNGNLGTPLPGGAEADDNVAVAFQIFANSTATHGWSITNNCKHEANRLARFATILTAI
jgi:hypothetical protein